MTRAVLPRLVIVLIALGVAAVAPRPVAGCSVCRCGDPAFNALELNLYETGTFRVAVDWERLAE